MYKLLSALLLSVWLHEAAATGTALIPMQKCPGDEPVKVAVFQAGSYRDFQKVFFQTVLALTEDGLIKNISTPLSPDFIFDINDNYKNLAERTSGGCLEFLEDGLYDGKWEDELIKENEVKLKARIKEKKDVDMIWALGTLAGKILADPSLGVPVLVMTSTDPESAGIIGPGEFSNKKNIHVQKEVGRYHSELKLFYDIFKFKNLGVIIDDDDANLAGQAYPIILQTAKELNFKLNVCRGPVIGVDDSIAQLAFSKCVATLAEKSDAVYIPMGNGASPTDMYFQIKPLIDNGIPTFSQTGVNEVEMGVLLSLSDSDLESSGRFEADVIKKILHGQKPEEISQYYYAPLSLSLNLQTAILIEWNPTFEVLIAVDKVFQTIKRPRQELRRQAVNARDHQEPEIQFIEG